MLGYQRGVGCPHKFSTLDEINKTLKFGRERKVGAIGQQFYNNNCRVTNCSPHLDGNRKWAQQAQYNKFVREWVKELG